MKKKFPEDFFHYKGGYVLSDQDTQEMIDRCLEYLKMYPNDTRFSTATGDTKVSATRFEDGIEICVYKNYYTIMIK